MRGDLQEQKSPKDSCITKALPSMSDPSQTWEPGVLCTARRQLMKLEGALSRCPSWCKPLAGSSHGFCFQTSGLVSEPPLQLALKFLLLTLTLFGFRDFLKLY